MTKTCSISNCDNPSRARGWCPKHYTRWINNGDPLVSKLDRETLTCTKRGCTDKKYGNKLCKTHYGYEYVRRPYYSMWRGMMDRCYKESIKSYSDYGARGIKVCSRWRNYSNYKHDILTLGERPSPNHTLDRIDNNGDYELSNIKWSTRLEQNLNRRTFKNNKVGVKGVSWHKRVNKWVAQIRLDGKKTHLGYFSTIEEASSAYSKASINQRSA